MLLHILSDGLLGCYTSFAARPPERLPIGSPLAAPLGAPSATPSPPVATSRLPPVFPVGSSLVAAPPII